MYYIHIYITLFIINYSFKMKNKNIIKLYLIFFLQDNCFKYRALRYFVGFSLLNIFSMGVDINRHFQRFIGTQRSLELAVIIMAI